VDCVPLHTNRGPNLKAFARLWVRAARQMRLRQIGLSNNYRSLVRDKMLNCLLSLSAWLVWSFRGRPAAAEIKLASMTSPDLS
jgi:hypothetical protein